MLLSQYDKDHIQEILLGEGDWFTARLLRLIAKADWENREKLREVYPEAVEAFEAWERQEVSS